MSKLKAFKDGIYHICNKSIANFGIFKEKSNAKRFLEIVDYYNNTYVGMSFSQMLKKGKYHYWNIIYPRKDRLIKILSFCIMPDHYHFLIKILTDYPLSKYVNDIENSYSRYFNLKNRRKGPLWESSYRIVEISSNEQLLHVSRYIHLNPTTSRLVTRPEDWFFSSYRYIISDKNLLKKYLPEISIRRKEEYHKFVYNNKDYQTKLKQIKRLLLD